MASGGQIPASSLPQAGGGGPSNNNTISNNINSTLDLVRQRAHKAAQFYQQQQQQQQQQQVEYGGAEESHPSDKPSSASSHHHHNTQFNVGHGSYAENGNALSGLGGVMAHQDYDAGWGPGINTVSGPGGGGYTNITRVLSDDSFETAMAPPTSNSFYRAKMRAGIIDMRSSYNERSRGGASRSRARTFHGPHNNSRSRTQTYALDSNKHSPGVPLVQQEQQKLSGPAQTFSSNHHSQQSNQQQPHHPHLPQQAAPQKPARTYAVNRAMLQRSSSEIEVDSLEQEALFPSGGPASLGGLPTVIGGGGGSGLHREYGSTSSLDVLGTSSDNFFSLISEYRQSQQLAQALDQRSPAPPGLHQLLQGRLGAASSEPQIQAGGSGGNDGDSAGAAIKFLNGSVTPAPAPSNEREGDFQGDEVDLGNKSSKTKSKHKDRKQRAKSITGEGSASILKKLRGKVEPDFSNTKSEEKGAVVEDPPSSKIDDRTRRRAFVHFDCQSVGVDLVKVIHQRSTAGNMKNNMTTGASAASGQRSSMAPDKDDPDLLAETDEGDGKSNDLVLSCPFFRNELGGEDERTVSLTKLTAHKRVSNSTSVPLTMSSINNKSQVRHPACCGVAILDSSPSPSGQILPPLVSHRGHVIEYVDHGAYYYRHFFYNHDHQNMFGTDEALGPIAISVRREKVDLDERTNNLGRADYGTAQYRIICRTSELTTLRGCVLEEAIPSRFSSSRGIPIKDVLELVVPEVQLTCVRQAVAGHKTCEQLLKLDEQGISNTYKVGIMYCKANQSSEEEMYNNETGGPALEEFLNLISQRVRLKGFEKYRAGLDTRTDTTGEYSCYTTFNNNEIMFHVSTMLPFSKNNKQQLLRKRHIGNDIVTIVFQEPGALPFTPQTVRSQFQHVFIIIRVTNPNSDGARYSIAITRSKDVPPFGPPIPQNCSFKKTQEFVDFLLAKIINAENAAHKSDKFRTMATRTRQEYLKDLATNYITSTPIDSGSKLSKFGLGSGRKKEKPKQKVVPDMFAKGALVWEVQIEDMGTASQVECLLAIAADTIVLVEETNNDVIFTIPCSTVIGWTPQPSSLRLYFGSGECLLLRPLSGEAEEMQEIIVRLQAVTNGTETSKMVLKRNGLGQLGFHIQSEGIVTDVEPYGFAWEAGLRKGSRLVEICKVATTTLSHDQIVDLLRTSAVVKVVVVPPMEDGSPRGDNSLNTMNAPLLPTSSNPGKFSPPAPQQHHHHHQQQQPQQQMPQYHHQQHPHSNQTTDSSPRARPHHGYSDSTLSSGLSSDDGRSATGALGVAQGHHSRQESADLYGSLRSHDSHASSGEDPHSRNNSHDSTDYSMSGVSSRSRSSQPNQPVLRRSERVLGGSTDISMDSSIYGTSSTVAGGSGAGPGPKRQFATMEYNSGIPATGNIAMELLKQTQNTKYLLGHGGQGGQGNVSSGGPGGVSRSIVPAHDNPGSASNLSHISEGSSSGSSQYTHPGRLSKDEIMQRRKDAPSRPAKPVMKKGYTEPPSSSPRSTRRNLSGMASEESLASRLRPGVINQKLNSQIAKADFQEELMRLIDPDLTEKDLVAFKNRASQSRKPSRLQRTFSDESLHNSKGGSTEQVDDSTSQRLSPRAVSDLASARQRSKSTVDNRVPILESAAALDWSKLVNVASKAVDETDPSCQHGSRRNPYEEEDMPPPRPPSPQMSVALSSSPSSMSASYASTAVTPQQKISDLEQKVTKLTQKLEKERLDKAAMEAEIQHLRADNVRLQEESQTAATQLRRFTEWFFNTIDRQ
ncbi:signal-induced proliferation-associated 1-like protein 1 [Elysia marginata]|uniref:Signal-induced proliferation-associated 1-like protein 1 n=1 Tax=Elysia marginata TaxID=1093978 RepID=A0AAV4INK0_9GAST|nr:signal-induced proliferation-associated 1-like protein 1 [Elysia marginata]